MATRQGGKSVDFSEYLDDQRRQLARVGGHADGTARPIFERAVRKQWENKYDRGQPDNGKHAETLLTRRQGRKDVAKRPWVRRALPATGRSKAAGPTDGISPSNAYCLTGLTCPPISYERGVMQWEGLVVKPLDEDDCGASAEVECARAREQKCRQTSQKCRKSPQNPIYSKAESMHRRALEGSEMMMMMMIFICVRRDPGETRGPKTSGRVRGRAKLWNYNTEVVTLESISCKKQALKHMTMFLPRPIGVEIEYVCLHRQGDRNRRVSVSELLKAGREAYNKGKIDRVELRGGSQ